MLYCAHRIELIITRKHLLQIVLYLNTPKINCLVSDSISLSQYQLLSLIELDFPFCLT